MRITRNANSAAIVGIMIGISYLTCQFPKQNTPQPPPISTIIVDEDEQYERREAFIEQIHSSAPGENWRMMDLNFRLNRVNNKELRKHNPNPIFGKWNEIGSNNQAGRTLVADYDRISNQLYVAASGGQIWKSTLGAGDWSSLNDQFKIPSIQFLKNLPLENNDRLIIGSGIRNNTGIMYSDDEGKSWKKAKGLESIHSWGRIKRTVMKNDPTQGIYVLALQWDFVNSTPMSRLYVSHDMGENFELLTTFPNDAAQVDIWTDPRNNGELFVLANDSLYTVDDYSNVEFRGAVNAGESERVFLAGAFINGAYHLYSLQLHDGDAQFYASNEDGSTWTYKGMLNFSPFTINSFKASPVTEGLLYYGGVEAFTSHDHGTSWSIVNTWGAYYNAPHNTLHADIPSFDSFVDNDENEFVIINTDGGAYISYDDLGSVMNLSLENLRISQYYSSYTCRFAPQYSHAGSQDQGYQFSDQEADESVIDYEQIISGDYGNIVSGDGGASIWMVYPTFAMYSPDANNNGILPRWSFEGDGYQWLPKLMEDPNDPASVYLAGGGLDSGAHLIHLTYSSGKINSTEEPFDFSNGKDATISALAYSPIDSDHRYVLTTERDFFYSNDGGQSWVLTDEFEGPAAHFFYGASIEPSMTTLGLVYIAGSGYSNSAVFVSENHGESFQTYEFGLPRTLVFDLALSPNDSFLFAATEVGAYICKTWRGTWHDIGNDVLPDQSFWAVDFVPELNSARFASYGRGIWEYDLNPDVEAAFEADQLLVTAGGTVYFSDMSLWNPRSWKWSFQGGEPATSDLQNPIVSYPTAGIYDVSLIVSNGNSTDTMIVPAYIEVEQSTSVQSISTSDFMLFPNPASNRIAVKSNKTIDRIEIWNSYGVKVFDSDASQATNDHVIDINSLPTGIYLLVLSAENGESVKQFVKY